MPLTRAIAGLAVCSCSVLEPSLGPEQETIDGGDGAAPVVFARDIRPLMNRSNTDVTGYGCAFCHYPGQGTAAGYDVTHLDLSTLGTLRLGGATTGTSIINVAAPEQSGLIEKLRGHYFEGDRMPKSGPPYWSDDEIQLVVTWMSQGALGADGD